MNRAGAVPIAYWARHLLPGLVLLAATTGCGDQAKPHPTDVVPSASLIREHRQTVDLSAVASEIRRMGGTAFAGLRIVEDEQTVEAFWRGPAPNDVVDYASTKPNGARVVVHTDAAFTRVQLMQAAQRITNDADAVTKAKIATVSVNFDGSGLTVGVESAVPGSELRHRLASLAELPAKAIRYLPNSGLSDLGG